MTKRSPNFYAAVFVFLKNTDGQYLLQQRMNTGYMDGHYESSSSGHVESGETIYEAAIRETKEEIGVTIKSEDMKLVLVSQMDVDRPYLNFSFICETWFNTPEIKEPEKCSDLRWFPTDDLPSNVTPTLHLMKQRDFSTALGYEYYSDKNVKQS